jgi:cation/acetate symporter
MHSPTKPEFQSQLHRLFGWYTLGVVAFIGAMALLEQLGMRREWIGISFLLATLGVYTAIGIVCRTTDANEYYVAGRSIPAIYNGMAAAADWMSAASFIGLAGTLYLGGFSALAFIMGWTGGYCLVALLVAPYLRRFGQFTLPDFFGERYGNGAPRIIAALAAIGCSFIYVVAQIYGVGLISTRLTGVAFEIGIFLGLGGVMVCSFLGGMRAVTWTQVSQFVVMIIAFLIPVLWLSVKQTGLPLPQLIYGLQLEKVSAKEAQLIADPREQEVMAVYKQRVAELDTKLANPRKAMAQDVLEGRRKLAEMKASNAPLRELASAERALNNLPKDEASARSAWLAAREQALTRAKPLGGMPRHAAQFAGNPEGTAAERTQFDTERKNFLALVLCLMLGTAALPHVLTRFYTTHSVADARSSVTWTLFFILLLYLTVPALAVLVKYEIFHNLVGIPFDKLPPWITQWSRVDATLLSVSDINRDGILQLGEISISSDIVMLATPEIAGLPYVISGLVAAGGLAAALSTADGLLLTITSALSHDLYYKTVSPTASVIRRVTISKALLLVVAAGAAYAAAQKPGEIIFMVSAAFSLSAATLFPALVLGIFWRRANASGAIAGMLAGMGITSYYMVVTQPWLRGLFNIQQPIALWWDIQPLAAGLFGVPLGMLTIVGVSLLTTPPNQTQQALIDRVRLPQ